MSGTGIWGVRLCFERAIARARDQLARLFEPNAARDLAMLSAGAGHIPARSNSCAPPRIGFQQPSRSPSSLSAAPCCD